MLSSIGGVVADSPNAAAAAKGDEENDAATACGGAGVGGRVRGAMAGPSFINAGRYGVGGLCICGCSTWLSKAVVIKRRHKKGRRVKKGTGRKGDFVLL